MTEVETRILFQKLKNKYQENPVFFAKHCLGVWTWSKMNEIMMSVARNQKTICWACHGSSKTYTAAIIAVWFFNAFFDPEKETKVITTSATFRQVQKQLWPNIKKIYGQSRMKLRGELTQTEIKVPGFPESYAIGFATNDSSAAEGWHAWNLLFILDEAKGIDQYVWDMAMAQMGGGNAKMLAISTTDGVEPGSEFHKAAKSPLYKDWNRIEIDCMKLPTFTGEKFKRYVWENNSLFDYHEETAKIDDLFIQLSTPAWEADWKEKKGEKHILYLTKCRGKIVDELPDQIIPLWKVEKMFSNYEDPNFDDTGVEEVGIDVARMGDDSTVAWKRKGLKIIQGPIKLQKLRSFQVVDRLEKEGMLDRKDLTIKVDDTGLGGGVTDTLIERGYTQVIPLNFNQKANDEDNYPNLIAEMWWELEDKIDKIACPRDDELLSQLVGRKNRDSENESPLDTKGRRKIESKQHYKNRTGEESPDTADSFLMTFLDYEAEGAYIGEGPQLYY